MKMLSEAELASGLEGIEPIFDELMLLVPMSDRGKPSTQKKVLKFLLDELKRGFLMKRDLLEPFRMKDEDGSAVEDQEIQP